jgi:hypothetical protein
LHRLRIHSAEEALLLPCSRFRDGAGAGSR